MPVLQMEMEILVYLHFPPVFGSFVCREFVDILQQELVAAGVLPEDYDFEAHKELVPMQPGDVPVTYADTSALERDFGFKPSTTLRQGLRNFAQWYRAFYQK